MASSAFSRPHRQARSGVSYREPSFFYEDDLAFCCRRPRSSITAKQRGTKKTVAHGSGTANTTSISKVRRLNAKERAEAVHLQRAIDESLLDRVPEAAMHLHNARHEDFLNNHIDPLIRGRMWENMKERDTMDSLFEFKKVMMDQAEYNCLAFQCLLDVASEAVLDGDIQINESRNAKEGLVHIKDEEDEVLKFSMERPHSGGTEKKVMQLDVNLEHSESKESSEVNVKVLKFSMERPHSGRTEKKVMQLDVSLEHSESKESSEVKAHSMDEEDRDSEQAATEDESSDLSDEAGCKRKERVKEKPKDRRNNTDVIPAGQMKKVGSASERRLNLLSLASCQPSFIRTRKPMALRVVSSGGNENIPTYSMESTQRRQRQVSYLRPQVASENGNISLSCSSFQNLNGFRKLEKSQLFKSDSHSPEGDEPESLFASLSAQSSILLHRRVIGLSRRFRPPPLHPYLSRQSR